ncbi:hypothetical protein C8R43DRAFT_959794 [Mycena crocata]|nr:hypothetical protein C8R43DRAFT_959794 [Mycena crocata]
MSQPRKNGPYSAEERRFMQNFNSSTHREERNAKTRERMAVLRHQEHTMPQAVQERRKEARRASAKKYREQNAWRLAQKARASREQARELKAEEAAHLARHQRRQQRLQALQAAAEPPEHNAETCYQVVFTTRLLVLGRTASIFFVAPPTPKLLYFSEVVPHKYKQFLFLARVLMALHCDFGKMVINSSPRRARASSGLPCGPPDGRYRCFPPWHGDTPRETAASYTKLYLATGPELGNDSGVYTSWNTASPIISGSRGAAAPSHPSWHSTVLTWQGGCDRGEHAHDSISQDGAVPVTPSRTVPITMGGRLHPAVPASTPPRRSAPPPTPSPAQPPRTQNVTPASPVAGPLRPPRYYGVRWGDLGYVCVSLEEAQDLYGQLERQGISPCMLTTGSFMDAACFADGFSPTCPTEESEERTAWMGQWVRD